jgi:acetyl-CoA carboxylase carboxyltransferase component
MHEKSRGLLQAYLVLQSQVDVAGETFRTNEAGNLAALETVAAAQRLALAGGGARYQERHKAAGKLLPRERIELLLDRDAPFLEICALAGHEVKDHSSGAGIIGGVGVISGVECVVTASDATQKGGAVSELGVCTMP